METTPADAYLTHIVQTCLLAQDTKVMMDCMTIHSGNFLDLTDVQDRLGWDNFVEGRISKLFLSYVQSSIWVSESKKWQNDGVKHS